MVRRVGHFLVALWWLTWVLVIIPAHTRGAISVGGTCAECASGKGVPLFFGTVPACCAGKGGKESGSKGRSGDCAVCQIVATTSHVGAVLPALTYLRLVEILPPATPSGAFHYEPILPRQSRAPPVG